MKIIKIPFGGGGLGHGDGAKHAPEQIEKQLKEIFTNESGLVPFFSFESVDVDNSNIELSHKNIFEKIKTINEKCIILGGDHSISNPCFKAFKENNSKAGIVVFDAHPDLMSSVGVRSQEDWLRDLIDNKLVEDVILIGLRSNDPEENEYIKEKKITAYPMKLIFSNEIENICDAVMEKIKDWNAVYLSIDIDAVDPAFAPGTGYQEPGGLSSRELIYFIQRLNKLKNIKMIDIVEVNPEKDINNMTSKLAAKIMGELQ